MRYKRMSGEDNGVELQNDPRLKLDHKREFYRTKLIAVAMLNGLEIWVNVINFKTYIFHRIPTIKRKISLKRFTKYFNI